jgi:hypothetical protein
MHRLLFLFTVSALVFQGCASVNTFDVPKTQQSLSEAMRRSDEVMQKAQNDFAEKKALIDSLGKGGAPAFHAAEGDLRARLQEMQGHLDTMTVERKKMLDANSDIASLGYGRERLTASDREFNKFDAAVKEFRRSADNANRAVSEYSGLSNALTDRIAEQKLFQSFQSSDFHHRVQQNVKVSQDNAANMQQELNRADALLDHGAANKAARKKLEGLYASMRSQATAYTERAQRLAQISHEMRQVTVDERVTSIDPEWPRAQKLITELDQVVHELEQLNVKFQKSAEDFRNSAKREP